MHKPITYHYDECAGYDCMTGGFCIQDANKHDIVVVDLRQFGQEPCGTPSQETMEKAEAVAKIIVEALNK